MLGEQIYEAHGKRTGRRVLSTDGGKFKVEVSFEATGKLLGFESFEIGTSGRNRGPTAPCMEKAKG